MPAATTTPPIPCFDIGGTFIKFGLSPAPGKISASDRVATPCQSFADFCAAISGLLRQHDPDGAGPVALSLAGLVDPATGRVTSANIPAMSGRTLAADLAAALGRPVVAANDADCLTLAEAHAGAGAGHGVVFCIILGTGVGGGLAFDGRIVTGARGVTGEWGHGPVLNGLIDLKDGKSPRIVPRMACGCGQSGCLDTVGAARGIERLHTVLHSEKIDSVAIVDDWQAGKAKACETVAVWLEMVADPLAMAVNLTGASIIPVGGGLAAATSLIAALDATVRDRTLNRYDAPLIVPARHREQGGLIGAGILARQKTSAPAGSTDK